MDQLENRRVAWRINLIGQPRNEGVDVFYGLETGGGKGVGEGVVGV